MTKIVPAGEGDCFETRSDSRYIKLEGADTGGEYTLIEHTIKPGFDAPVQLHRRHSAAFFCWRERSRSPSAPGGLRPRPA